MCKRNLNKGTTILFFYEFIYLSKLRLHRHWFKPECMLKLDMVVLILIIIEFLIKVTCFI